jgi:UDP-N-acetylglucosamine--N-acetylmuramyl-(pentapeptide) pyrophosphoryl-undecaprenol N-acetylglucosamine transferase
LYFVVTAGGTAGHINPAIAVADELQRRGHEILFVGTPDHIEARLAKQAGFDFTGFAVSGFDKAHPLTLVTSGTKLLKATRKAKQMFEERRPDAVIAFGAYVSIPVGRAAYEMHIPLVIHEQNSVPGMANAYLSKHATVTALTYAQSAAGLESKYEPVVLGNPVRASFETCSRNEGRKALGIPEDALVLLIIGGSLGAQHLNEAMCALKERLLAIDDLYVIHSTGERDHDAVIERLALTPEESQRWKVSPYIDAMGPTIAASDLIVSRAGASSLAEIMTIGVPSVLIPYPHARGDHQTLNAQSCVSVGAAELIADADVETPAFSNLIVELLGDRARRDTMATACKQLSGTDARVRLADIVEQCAQGK